MVRSHFERGHVQSNSMSLAQEEYTMVNSRLWMAGVTFAAALLSGPGRTNAQDRTPSTKDDAVLSIDGVVREVFQSARKDRVDLIVQIEVKRSEAIRAPRTPLR